MNREDLEKLGLSKEQIDSVLDMHHEEYDVVNEELKTTKGELDVANEKIKTTEDALKKFDGVDPEALNKQIEDLKTDLKQKDDDYASKIAERDFSDLVSNSIKTANGKNEKAIKALLDVETLKTSKNQKEDIASAIKALTEAEDSKMLFGEAQANPVGTGNMIGAIEKGSTPTTATLKDALKENYK